MSLKKKIVWPPYDFDTALGINNEGLLVFGYELEDTDLTAAGKEIYNGQNSVLWNNIRDAFTDELNAMYRNLRSTGALSYEKVEQMFEEHQSKWPERLVNEDSKFKYIDPGVEDGNWSNLGMLQGLKTEQRKWWGYNRFRYIDSKRNAGDALADFITLRGYAKSNITVRPYADIYPTVKYGSYVVSTRGKRGTTTTLVCPLDALNDTEIYIYSSSQLASVGDLSGLMVGYADFSMATRLQEIKLGDSDANYNNGNLLQLTLGNNVLLKKLDVRNCSGLGNTAQEGHTQTSVDISGCEIIEEVYFEGTKIQGLTLPNGGNLKKLHLPETMANITVMNQKALTEFTMEGSDYSNVRTLRVENSSSVIPVMDILNDMSAGSRVRLIGFTTAAEGSTDAEKIASVEAFYTKLESMRGLDEQGRDETTAQVSGTITGLGTITGAWLASMKARFPDINFEYEHITSNLYYYNGETLYHTETITDGGNGTYSGTPTKASTAQYSYSFTGWSKTDDNTVDSDARTGVTADRSVYACFAATVRTYTVYWKNSDGTTLETDNNVPYGTTPTYNGSTPQNPTSGGGAFQGWAPAIGPVTGNTTYTASYTPRYTVTWYNDDQATILDQQTVTQGSSATYAGNEPVSTNGSTYTFTGWSTSTSNVQSDMSVYAQYKAPKVFHNPSFDVTGAYAVQWDYSDTDPVLTRGGAAAAFADPTPAEGVSGSGSSPFDAILPWSGMKRYNIISNALSYSQDDASFNETTYDTVVYIPEFYYAVEKDTTNNRWTWAISPTAKTGYQKHPGSGRYVGRFHTAGDSTEVFTKSGLTPLASTTQTDFRTYSHNKGTNWYMLDYASWSAIQMLYLVEFGTFDSQTALGKGWNTGSAGAMGGTTGAAYHTIKTTGAHNMYRWIEDPFSNVLDNIDGFIASGLAVYAGVSDTGYAGTTSDLTATGVTLPSSGAIQGFGYSADAPWAFIPDTASGTDYTTYVTDRVASYTDARVARVGGVYDDNAYYGFFCLYANNNASNTGAFYGSRLLYIP